MHIVVLTGYFYPNLMAPSACVKPYLQELAKENEVDVICPMSDPKYSECVVVDNINVYFVSNGFNSLLAKAGKYNLISRCLSFIARGINYSKMYLLPSPYDSSLKKSFLKKLDAINERHKIDTIISVTFPFYTHVFALKYKYKHPNVNWITYTTDPLAYNEANPMPKWKMKRAEKIEKEVYENCNTCLITEELKQNLLGDYHIPEHKVVVLPYLIETSIKPLQPKVRQSEIPQILYAGCLFYRVRNPQIMLNVFSGMKDVDLNLYVTGDRICRKMLKGQFPENIKINNVVPREEYLRLLRESDILVNLSNNAKLQAPHKLLELISTGRPIINFYYYKNSGYELIEKYPLGINIDNNMALEKIIEVLRGFIKRNADKSITFSEVQTIYPDHILDNQMPYLKKIIGC